MSMMRLSILLPEVAASETRTVFLQPEPGLIPKTDVPAGAYLFDEVYCVERGCDCRRVMINVLGKQPPAWLATINHAFEPPGADGVVPEQTFLDPLNRQSGWSDDLLDLFLHVLRIDPAYGRRLVSHYHMVKGALKNPAHPIHARIRSADFPSRTRSVKSASSRQLSRKARKKRRR